MLRASPPLQREMGTERLLPSRCASVLRWSGPLMTGGGGYPMGTPNLFLVIGYSMAAVSAFGEAVLAGFAAWMYSLGLAPSY